MTLLVVMAASVLLGAPPKESGNAVKVFHDNLRYYWNGKEKLDFVNPEEVKVKTESKQKEKKKVSSLTVYFDFDSAVLKEKEKKKFEKVKEGERVEVEGHASPEGSEEYNLRLSLQRAKNVAGFLKKRGAVVEGIKGYGEEMCDLDRKEWWKCRKVEVKIR